MSEVRAMAVTPGQEGSGRVVTLDAPPGDGDLVVRGLAIGICGTDVEISSGAYGTAPGDDGLLVLGHESLGRVESAPEGSGFAAGDLVVGIVRRPDPVPCRPCAAGAWDMCRNGRYTERGIKERHGYGATTWRVEPDFAVRVSDSLGDLGVLLEPTSVVSKAWEHVEHIAGRAPIRLSSALVTGAGPIGLLAALIGRQRGLDVHVLDRATSGPKPDLVADLGATYVTSLDRVPEVDVVIECTGADEVVLAVLGETRPAGLVCLTGVSSGGRRIPVDVGKLNLGLVLENDVVFGSVNANRRHYEAGADALAAADPAWLGGLLTRHVPLDRWTDALEKHDDDVKVVVDLTRPDRP